MGVPDDERDAFHFAREPFQSGTAVAVETVAQQQIFRGISAQCELWGEHQACSGGARPLAVVEDL
jgi:hypothetical protein